MVGLALAGGGVKGSYEVGAYIAMKKCHLKFDGITGTSIGAFNAAMIASNKINELYNFWKTIDVSSILGLNESFIEVLKTNEKSKIFHEGFNELVTIIKNHGLNVEGLQEKLAEFNIENDLRKSKIDFGICTYKINTHEAIEIFKSDISEGKIEEYIIASCYLPIFKPKKLIDDGNYFDGGIHDNCPTNMLLKKGYDKVFEIDLHAIGRKRKSIDENKVITINPSRKLSGIISLDNNKIYENMQMGYYDTLKILKNYPGNDFIFKKIPKFMEYYLLKKTKENNIESLIGKIEKLMKKDNYTYYQVYSLNKILKKYKKQV